MTADVLDFKPRACAQAAPREMPDTPARNADWPHEWTSKLKRIRRSVDSLWPKQCMDCDVLVFTPDELAAENKLGCSVAPDVLPDDPRPKRAG